MKNNTYGLNLNYSVEGGSHDPEIRMCLSGFPEGVHIDMESLLSHMKRRAPGQNAWSTQRREADIPVFESGIGEDGCTNGQTIRVVIKNSDQHSTDYAFVYDTPRPGHADYPALVKYGSGVDLRGGGRFSGRLTALLCVVGFLCMSYLSKRGISVGAHILSLGGVSDVPFDPVRVDGKNFETIRNRSFPTLNVSAGERMKEKITKAKEAGDSIGGLIECAATGLPCGLGEHPFASVESRVSSLMYAIPAVKGVWFGDLSKADTCWLGSYNNDPYTMENGRVVTKTNHAGGILGGMTTGMPLLCTVAVKPTPSIARTQQTVSLTAKEERHLTVPGRHDPCILPRAVPVVESALALSLTDMMLDPLEV